jgi:large subunit ribosomal protein L22e
MVAVRNKVGARGFIRTTPLKKGKKVFKIDLSIPMKDGVFDAELAGAFEQHFLSNTKLHGKKGKLADKVKINFDKDKSQLAVSTTMQYRKKYFKYLTKKFLKKKNMREFFRILSSGKGEYQLRYYRVQDEEQE